MRQCALHLIVSACFVISCDATVLASYGAFDSQTGPDTFATS